MIQHLLFVYGKNLKRAELLVDDLTDEQMAAQPSGVINHPAWTLGHLGVTSDALAGMLGLPSTFPDKWKEAGRMGSIPSGNAADFPRQGGDPGAAPRAARAGVGSDGEGR